MTRPLWLLLLLTATSSLSAQGPPSNAHLDPIPLFRLGGASGTGPTEFSNPYAAAVLEDGIAVLEGATQEIRLFDLTGRHTATFGRRGAGPGEFSNAAYLQALPGDSLFVSDLQQYRYTIFDPAGRPVRVVSLAATSRGAALTPLGRFSDGSILARRMLFPAGGGATQQMAAAILQVSPDGTRTDSLGVLPLTNVLSVRGGWRAPLGTGQMHATVAGMKAYFNAVSEFRVHIWDAGQRRWTERAESRSPRLTTAAMADRQRARLVAQGVSIDVAAGMPVADTLPSLVQPLSDALGRLWLVEAPDTDPVVTFFVSVYASDGQRIARLPIPEGLRPLAVGREFIVAGGDDADGIPVLAVFRVTIGQPPSLHH